MSPPDRWSGLPDDLLGGVLRRLPSFADRARLRDVCRRWRSAWRAQPHPAVPWHPDPGHCVSLDARDAKARVPLPADVACGAVCLGALGSWLALAPPPSPPGLPRPALFLLNAFSMARVPLPIWTDGDGGAIRKVVLSSAPGSRASCVAAAITDSLRTIAVYRSGQDPSAWSSLTMPFDVEDIAFHQGEVYVLDPSEQLHRVAVREPVLRVEHCPVAAERQVKVSVESRYLVELDGSLLMVRRYLVGRYTHAFCSLSNVFALRHHHDGACRRWAPGVRLNGRVLVVGNACCGAFPAGDFVDDRQICFVDGGVDWSTVAVDKGNLEMRIKSHSKVSFISDLPLQF